MAGAELVDDVLPATIQLLFYIKKRWMVFFLPILCQIKKINGQACDPGLVGPIA